MKSHQHPADGGNDEVEYTDEDSHKKFYSGGYF